MRQACDSGRGVDAPSTIIAACVITGVNALTVNLGPITTDALIQQRGLTDGGLGQINALSTGLFTLCILTAPFWVRSVSWRGVSVLGAAGACATALAGAIVVGLPAYLIVFGLMGVAQSIPGAITFASLGDTQDPERSFAAATVAQSLLAAVTALPLTSWVIPRFGVQGLFVTLSAFFAVAIVASLWLPRQGKKARVATAKAVTAGGVLAAPTIAILAFTLFTAGAAGFWTFVGRFGTVRGVDASIIGFTVGFSAVATIATGALMTWIGNRLPSLAFAVGGTAIILGGCLCLALPGKAPFLASALLFALGWGFAQPGFWAVLRNVDLTDRLFVMAPAASGVAAVAIGLLAGPVIGHSGYAGFIGFCVALISAGGLVLIVASMLAVRIAAAPRTGKVTRGAG